jgi:hypothetical protein
MKVLSFIPVNLNWISIVTLKVSLISCFRNDSSSFFRDNINGSTSNCFEPVNSEKIVNESSQATIRILTSHRQVNQIFPYDFLLFGFF